MKLNKKVTIFGKQISVIAIALLAMAGLASAGLLSYYGMITGTATVEQSVKLNDMTCTNIVGGGCTISYTVGASPTLAGSTYTNGPFKLTNGAEVPATVKLETTYDPALTDEEITTTYRGILELTDKVVAFGTTPWAIKGEKNATIWYTLTGTTFKWGYISSSGFDTAQYTLIYYKDNPKRFETPAEAIKVSEITGSLPYTGDANIDEYDYCGKTVVGNKTGDDYVHCHGAKLWLVPKTAILSGDKLDWSKASDFLFETDLIAYSANDEGKLTLPANGGGVNFEIENSFAINIFPYTYMITTNIVPGPA